MSGGADNMEVDGRPAQLPEQVWTTIVPTLDKLHDDLVCLAPDTKLKNEVKKKFKTHATVVKQAFLAKIDEFLKANQPKPVPEGPRKLVEVNTRDIRENLVSELVDSLNTLVQIAKDSQCKPDFSQLLDAKLDFLTRKVEASIDGFEGSFADRYQKQSGTRLFGPMDFNRHSLESDPLAPTAHGPEVSSFDFDDLQNDLGALRHKIASLEKELNVAREEAKDKTKRVVELNEYLRLCDSMSTVLGCTKSELQKEVHELVTVTTAQNSKIDELRAQLTDFDSLQDHTDCKRRIEELEAQLEYKEVELHSEAQRVDLLSKTIKDLREELQKKGIGRSLDERLKQLGIVSTSSADAGSSPTSDPVNRYGPCDSDH